MRLDNWKSAAPDNPEMFVGYFNYYINMARNGTIVLGGQNPPGDEILRANLAYLYGSVGNICGAVRYYQLMEKSEDSEYSRCASEKLKRLQPGTLLMRERNPAVICRPGDLRKNPERDILNVQIISAYNDSAEDQETGFPLFLRKQKRDPATRIFMRDRRGTKRRPSYVSAQAAG